MLDGGARLQNLESMFKLHGQKIIAVHHDADRLVDRPHQHRDSIDIGVSSGSQYIFLFATCCCNNHLSAHLA